MRINTLISLCAGALASLAFCGQAAAATELYYTSSPQSWVGGGETVSVTPADGFDFVASRNFDNGVSFSIDDFASNPDFQETRWWYLDFAAPFSAPLTVGSYQGATRFPFQEDDEPGLSFTGNGRGDNTLTGWFNVLEVAYAPDGSVLFFAADFMQYDEGFQAWWNLGSIRYNSDIPAIPEPGTLALFGLGAAAIAARVRRR